ncbi:hypothetical protein THOM_2594 [Trachipleistophora hominis]|uniref:Uncharacterized protein n=1 Tax=Trachipleistophora hominis TaxID=72359 RepID=L7JSU2_TRAHO|nr:hypothetical protein THOM_2594 [Trachipleistophora hominis]
MHDALIIFDVPKETDIKTISPFLTEDNTIRGNDFLVVMAPLNMVNRLKEQNDAPSEHRKTYEMCTIKDLEGKDEGRVQLEQIKYDPPNNELFMLHSENMSYVFLNDFTGQLVKKAQFRGPVVVSNTGRYIVHGLSIYSGAEWLLYGMLPKGNVTFSYDDNFFTVEMGEGLVRIYNAKTLQFTVHEDVNSVQFGRGIVLIDHLVVELVKGSLESYKNLIRGYKSESPGMKNENNTFDHEETLHGRNKTESDRYDNNSVEHDSDENTFMTSSESENLVKGKDESDTDSVLGNWLDSDTNVDVVPDQEDVQIPDYESVHFSPYGYDVVAIDSELNFDRAGKIITRRHPQSTIKIFWTRNRCYAHISKRIGEREKCFIESYSDFVTVNEIGSLKDVKFADQSFLVDDGRVQYYELRNKRFVVVNTVEGADCFDLFDHLYVLGCDEKVKFFDRKTLYMEHNLIAERIEFSRSGLFVGIVSANQVNMFDCNGCLIYKRIFSDIKEFKFLNFVRLDEQTKKEIKGNYEEVVKLLGDEKDLNVSCFKRNDMPVEERKKAWITFLEGLK